MQIVFVQIVKNICPNGVHCFSIFDGRGDCNEASVFLQIVKCICANSKICLSKSQNQFVQIVKNICLNGVYCFSIFGGRRDCNEASWAAGLNIKLDLHESHQTKISISKILGFFAQLGVRNLSIEFEESPMSKTGQNPGPFEQIF